MKENLKITINMEKENTLTVMEMFMKENIRKERFMVKGNIPI